MNITRNRAGLTTAATIGIVVAALLAAGLIYRFGFADGRDERPDTVIVEDRTPDQVIVSTTQKFDDKGGDRDRGTGIDDRGPDDRGGDRR